MSFESKRLQESYEFFLEQRGEATFSQKVDNQVILNWENKLPSSLLRIWQELGGVVFIMAYYGLLTLMSINILWILGWTIPNINNLTIFIV